MPAAGGTQRLPRLIGIIKALPLLLQGESLEPSDALNAKLVHEVVPAGALIHRAKAIILAKPTAVQPWDEHGKMRPGLDAVTNQFFATTNAKLHAQTFGNYPALEAIASAVYEGYQVPIDAGLRIEARYMAKVMTHPTTRNMIRSQFINMQRARKRPARPKEAPASRLDKVGIVGSGAIGTGIAFASAVAGMSVALMGVGDQAASGAKANALELIDRAFERGKLDAGERSAILDRVHTSADRASLKDADLVIVAPPDDPAVKPGAGWQSIERRDCPVVLFNDLNTPIAHYAEKSPRPENVVGVHVLPPMREIQLVEIIRSKNTSDAALACAMDYVKKIGRISIVIDGDRGIYGARVAAAYAHEGIAALVEGVSPALIENVGKMTGMAAPPLAFCDEVGLDFLLGAFESRQNDNRDPHWSSSVVDMVRRLVEAGRLGRKAGKGFYDYPTGESKRLWPGYSGKAGPIAQTAVEELKKRFLYIQALEFCSMS